MYHTSSRRRAHSPDIAVFCSTPIKTLRSSSERRLRNSEVMLTNTNPSLATTIPWDNNSDSDGFLGSSPSTSTNYSLRKITRATRSTRDRITMARSLDDAYSRNGSASSDTDSLTPTPSPNQSPNTSSNNITFSSPLKGNELFNEIAGLDFEDDPFDKSTGTGSGTGSGTTSATTIAALAAQQSNHLPFHSITQHFASSVTTSSNHHSHSHNNNAVPLILSYEINYPPNGKHHNNNYPGKNQHYFNGVAQQASSSPKKMNMNILKVPTIRPNYILNGDNSAHSGSTLSADHDHFRPGRVVSLKLWNLLSQVEFEKNWHPSLNFVVGQNGSGKSSIMAGLLLALGGKAGALGRKSVLECINHAATSAKVEIELAHGGELNSERYGDIVGIRRTIDARGGSKYDVRDGSEKWRPMKSMELDRILATLQIMPDNPLQFLNQKVASSFLTRNDPKQIYNFFYRGMRLSECEELLGKMRIDVDYVKRIMGNRQETHTQNEQKATGLKKDYDKVIYLKDMEQRIIFLKKEQIWAEVAHIEKEVESNEAELAKSEKQIQITKVRLENVGKKKEELEKTFESDKILSHNLALALRKQLEERETRRNESNSLKRAIHALKIQLNDADGTIKNSANAIQSLDNQVASLKADYEKNFEKRKREIEVERTKLTEQIQGLSATRTQASNINANMLAEVQTFKAAHEAQREMINERAKAIDRKRMELKNMDRQKRTQFDRFGNEMVRLVEKINANAHVFDVVPVGPQGACYTVKEEYKEYAPLVEHILLSKLYDFKVTTQRDHATLSRFIKEVYGPKNSRKGGGAGRRPDIFSILVKSYPEKVYNMSQKARCAYPTLLDVLDIVNNNPSVVNWLVDSMAVERILMFPSYSDGCQVMHNNDKRPRSSLCGYSQDTFIRAIYKDSVRAKESRKKATWVQVTSSTALSNAAIIDREIQDLESEQKDLKLDCAKLNSDLISKNSAYQKAEKDITKVTNQLITAQKALGNLGASSLSAVDIESYSERIDELKMVMAQKQEERRQLAIRLGDLQVPLNVAMEAVKRLDGEIMQGENNKNEIDSRADKSREMVETNRLEREHKAFQAELKKLELVEKELAKKNSEISALLKDKIDEAKLMCKRVETNRDKQSIKKEFDELALILEKNQPKLLQLRKIKKAWEKAEKFANDERETNKILSNLVICVEQMLSLGLKKLNQIKVNYGLSLAAKFNALISVKKYTGKLVVDHEGKTLTYFVCSDPNSKAIADGNFKKRMDGNLQIVHKKGIKDLQASLSGGERSFSTFCFLITLWSIMEAPFYIMDEFEVFMDQIHKAKCHQIIRDHAKEKHSAQFFFFTPTALEHMPGHDDGMVLKLAPPNRGPILHQAKRNGLDGNESPNPKKKAKVEL